MTLPSQKPGPRLARAIIAGALYAGGAFIVAFVTGVARTLLISQVQGLSPVVAVLLELPLILVAAWLICGLVIRRTQLTANSVTRFVMGLTAFVLMIAAEAGLSVLVTGGGLEGFVASFAHAEAQLGLAGQIVYALFPLLRR